MSRSVAPRLRLPVTGPSRKKGSAPALRGRASSDVVTRRALVLGGLVLAALMLILSAQSTPARSPPATAADAAVAATAVEAAQL
jgi:hypothetical protein